MITECVVFVHVCILLPLDTQCQYDAIVTLKGFLTLVGGAGVPYLRGKGTLIDILQKGKINTSTCRKYILLFMCNFRPFHHFMYNNVFKHLSNFIGIRTNLTSRSPIQNKVVGGSY